MKKITIITLHLGFGGIERVVISLANMLADTYNVEIISTYKVLDKPAFEIDNRVKVKYLIDDKPKRDSFLSCLKKLKLFSAFKIGLNSSKLLYYKRKLMINFIKNCNSDVIISTRSLHNKWIGKYAKKNIKKIGWEHNYHNNKKRYINQVIKSALNLDYFVSVSKELNSFYSDKLKNVKCSSIYNSIAFIPTEHSKLATKNIIAVGRLSKEKGFDDLIDIVKTLNEKDDVKLHLLGDGPLYESLKDKVNKLGLEKNVLMHGFVKQADFSKYYLESSMFVMTSHTEAFPLVLLESFAYGVPCIAFDCASGPQEIIINDYNGYLISNRDKEKMANTILKVINDKEKLYELGNNALRTSKLYHADNIKNEWINIIEE